MSAGGMRGAVPLPKPAETIKSNPKDQENLVTSDVPPRDKKDAGDLKNNEEEKEEEQNNKQALSKNDDEADDDGRPRKEAPLTERKKNEVKALIDPADQEGKNDRVQEEEEEEVEKKEGGQRREPLVPQAPDPKEEESVKKAEKEEKDVKKEEEGKKKEEVKEEAVQDEGNKNQVGKSRALQLSEPQPKNSDENRPEESKKKGDNESKVGRTEEGNTKEEAKANQEALPKANQANATPRNEEKKESPLGTVRRQTTPRKTAAKFQNSRRNSIAERLGLNALHRHVGRPR